MKLKDVRKGDRIKLSRLGKIWTVIRPSIAETLTGHKLPRTNYIVLKDRRGHTCCYYDQDSQWNKKVYRA